MWIIKSNNKFVSYLIILFSLFVLFLVTYNQYEILQENLVVKQDLQIESDDKNKEITKNSEIESKMKNDINITKKYLSSVKEEEIIEYIFDYVENYNTDNSKIYLIDISLSEWSKNDLWFNQSNINLSVNVSNFETMKRFLDFFVAPNSKYNFIIDSFNFPNDWREWSFNLNIPLKIYYK